MIPVNVPTEISLPCWDAEKRVWTEGREWYPIIAIVPAADIPGGLGADILYLRDGLITSTSAIGAKVRGMLVRAPEDAEVAS